MNDLQRVQFELQHVSNKKHLSPDVRRRAFRNGLPVGYQEEFNQFVYHFAHDFGFDEFNADVSALKAVFLNMKFDDSHDKKAA